ncbi:unnamed protein product [Protopolystoma xenopodis]|uniref:Uncharacterized protein n=1 Tax=Protopolystoma xenopodis TaxID=117903 RepID=A0A3S4ZU76_9PLAT|nr:unnamed protein product [Protopolystoma xenopodis]
MMSRIRVLEQENEELAKANASGRTARLQGEIALNRCLVSDLKQANAGSSVYVRPM